TVVSASMLLLAPSGVAARQPAPTRPAHPSSISGGAVCLSPSSMGVGAMPARDVLADLDADGALDIAVADYGDDDVSVALGNGDGPFGVPARDAVGTGPQGILAADLDEDGTLDLATADTGSSSMSVLIGAGDGTFQPAVAYPIRTVNPQELVAGWFDGD